jgi:hypothetical protein
MTNEQIDDCVKKVCASQHQQQRCEKRNQALHELQRIPLRRSNPFCAPAKPEIQSRADRVLPMAPAHASNTLKHDTHIVLQRLEEAHNVILKDSSIS